MTFREQFRQILSELRLVLEGLSNEMSRTELAKGMTDRLTLYGLILIAALIPVVGVALLLQ